MPDLDGVAALRAVRRHKEERGDRRAPAIAVTAHALKGEADAFIASGFDFHLPKPFTREQLQAVLAAARSF